MTTKFKVKDQAKDLRVFMKTKMTVTATHCPPISHLYNHKCSLVVVKIPLIMVIKR